MTHIELIGRSYVGMENAFSEILRAEGVGYESKRWIRQKRRKGKESEMVIHGGIQ